MLQRPLLVMPYTGLLSLMANQIDKKTRQTEVTHPETTPTFCFSSHSTDSFQHVDYSHSFSQPVEAVEGGSATLQCRLDPPINLSKYIVDWNRGLTRQVHVYRSQRDDPELQMLQYRDRTALNHGDLTRGVLTLTISNVSLSDNGSYEVYLPKPEVTCLTHLTVVKEEEQTKRKDSGKPAAPAEGDPGGWMETLRGGEDRQTETVGNECENTNLNTDAETGDLQRDESETSV
ncbi:hypothetical protein NQZ68_013548 [Dissostichus eleginoides]|nr:hypothetical protein NQZ68_013548 [Dissostichus eleginoides]